MVGLSERTREIVRALFPKHQWGEVEAFLAVKCADNLPFCECHDCYEMERIRFSVLRLSEGRLEKLRQAIELARTDWRDLFEAAGFGDDAEAHRQWRP